MVRKKNNAKEPQNYKRKVPLRYWSPWMVYNYAKDKRFAKRWNYTEHLTANKIKEYLGDDLWKRYLKVSIVRNPWDQAVSWFEWQAKYGNNPITDFEEFLDRRYHSLWSYYLIEQDNYIVDYMIRFENLEFDFNQLLTKLKASDELELPKTKQGIRKERDYQKYFTSQNQIESVRFKNLQLLKLFPYSY
jgi:hypothetical protein